MKLEIISLKQSSCVINIPLGGRLAKNAEHSEHTIKSGDLEMVLFFYCRKLHRTC